MSALLEGFAVDGILAVTVGGSPPDHHKNGIPVEADGSIAVEMGTISHYSMGLPFTAAGRLAVDAGPVAYYGSGAATLSSSGMLVMGTGPLDHYASGVPYGDDGALYTTGLTQYVFNGGDQYATHAAWSPLGDYTVYPPEFTFSTDNPDGNIVDPTPPITEFGRVGGSYHSGSLSNLQYKDSSPLNGATVITGPMSTPDVNLENAIITVDVAYVSGAQKILGGTEAILDTDGADVLVLGANVDSVLVDGSAYAGAPMSGHSKLSVRVSSGVFNQLGEVSSFGGSLVISNDAY